MREIAILMTGAHFGSAYEIYAHIAVAEKQGQSEARLATLITGSRPSDLSAEEAVAYLPWSRRRPGGAGLSPGRPVSMTLSGFNMSVPERD
ncbi:MAG: hypothetical protein JWR00_2716 [Rubritepida sp.]|nr:hypothetical protein [Rubritepida sp.]